MYKELVCGASNECTAFAQNMAVVRLVHFSPSSLQQGSCWSLKGVDWKWRTWNWWTKCPGM